MVGVEEVEQEDVSVTEMRKAGNEKFCTVVRKWKANLHNVPVGREKFNA